MSDPETPRRLDHAPGDRYRGPASPSAPDPSGGPGAGTDRTPTAAAAATGAPAAGTARRGILAALAVAALVAVGRALVGQVDLGPGTLAIAAFGGWLVALALVWGAGGAAIPRRALVAGVIGGAAIAAGLVLESLVARAGGGALGPLDYVNERYGLLAYVEIAIAAGVAAVRAR